LSEDDRPAPRSDAELVLASIRRQAGAFEELVERHQGLVKLVAFRHSGVEADADDAAQEAFVRAYFSLPTLKDPAAFKSWLLTIASNVARDIARRRGRRPSVSLTLDEDAETPLPFEGISEAPTAPERLSQRELRLKIVEAIESLPDDYRQVAVLRYLEDLSYREIAARSGLREDTLRKRIHRANAVLRQKLRRYISEGP